MTTCDCSDTRLGVQAQLISTDMKKTFMMHDRLFLGLSGLASDIQTLSQVELVTSIYTYIYIFCSAGSMCAFGSGL